MYSSPVCCASGVPRKSRSGPMQAQTDPQTRPFSSSSAFTKAGSICDVSSTGISTVSKPHFLKVLNSFVLSLVNGEVNRKVFIPILISVRRACNGALQMSSAKENGCRRRDARGGKPQPHSSPNGIVGPTSVPHSRIKPQRTPQPSQCL